MKRFSMRSLTLYMLLLLNILPAQSMETNKPYVLWYNRPAYNRGGDFSRIVSRGFPYDEDWERWSLPIGNGYMGLCIFGRTDTERLQLSEKTLGNRGAYNLGGFTNFAEIYLDFRHRYTDHYRRELESTVVWLPSNMNMMARYTTANTSPIILTTSSPSN